MTKVNVLVFPCGAENAIEIHTALKTCVNVCVWGASSQEDHGRFVFRNYIGGLPYVSHPDFYCALNRVLEEHQIAFLFPTHDTVALGLSENRDQLKTRLILGDKETCRICRDKRSTYRTFKHCDFCPRIYDSPDDVAEYPIFVKPVCGQGSKGSRRMDSRGELIAFINRTEDIVICEYLPGEEITVDCFTDRHGCLRFIGPRHRERVWGGISVHSTAFKATPRISEITEAINAALNFRGLWYYQLKKNAAGDYMLMEISTRASCTMGLYRNLGVNLPLLSIYDAMNVDVDIVCNEYPIEVDRALISRYRIGYDYDTVYLDLDDTLIVNGHVNTLLLTYLYQAVERGTKIVLLTRHAHDISATLRRYRVHEELFARIVPVRDGEEKSEFVISQRAIFIDNSFAERKKVAAACCIPVFDVDAVQSLLDWRE